MQKPVLVGVNVCLSEPVVMYYYLKAAAVYFKHLWHCNNVVWEIGYWVPAIDQILTENTPYIAANPTIL